jgi:hypothetical protein
MRAGFAVSLAVVPLLTAGFAAPPPPSACVLLTASDASTLAGSPVTLVNDDINATSCGYGTGGDVMGKAIVQITVGIFPDAATAHSEYRSWNAIDPPLPPTETVTSVSGVADEADITHTTPSELSAIDFRKGATVVRIGVRPPASDGALKTAALTVASRL